MLITILTAGSRGDIQPYVALGRALQQAGSTVRLATFENYAPFIRSNGLEFVPVRGNIAQAVNSKAAQEAMQADNPLKLLFSFRQLQSMVFDLQEDFFSACQGSDAIVYHPGAAIGYFAAQHFTIPSILATPFPMVPTRAYPSIIFYDAPRLGRSANWLSHKIFEQIMWLSSSAPVKQFWKKRFGGAPRGFSAPYSRQTTQAFPTVISCSQYVFPKPPDWPGHVHCTGYWFLDNDEHWEPPDDLLEFLTTGKQPIYIGFGSIGNPQEAASTTQLLISALRQAGQRGVLASGWQGLAKLVDKPGDIYVLDSAPHAWLFPRMAAVVHHGGAGTTAAGFRAGVPQAIIPHGNDQFAWGRRVYELGAGARPIPRKQLSASKLAEAIQSALSDETKKAAAALGSRIRAEDGARSAARIILQSTG